jgi:hypothetical protein
MVNGRKSEIWGFRERGFSRVEMLKVCKWEKSEEGIFADFAGWVDNMDGMDGRLPGGGGFCGFCSKCGWAENEGAAGGKWLTGINRRF